MSEADKLLDQLLDAMLYIARKVEKEMNWQDMKACQDMYLEMTKSGQKTVASTKACDVLVEAIACYPAGPIKKAPETKMGKPMRYSANCDYCDDGDCDYGRPSNDNQRKLNYATGRIYSIREEKNSDLRKQFFMDEIKPKTVEDLIQRMKDGKYTVQPEEFQKSRLYWSPTDFIIWRTPEEKEDPDGYNKAREALEAAVIKAQDAANLLSSEEAAKALTELEAWTYTG